MHLMSSFFIRAADMLMVQKPQQQHAILETEVPLTMTLSTAPNNSHPQTVTVTSQQDELSGGEPIQIQIQINDVDAAYYQDQHTARFPQQVRNLRDQPQPMIQQALPRPAATTTTTTVTHQYALPQQQPMTMPTPVPTTTAHTHVIREPQPLRQTTYIHQTTFPPLLQYTPQVQQLVAPGPAINVLNKPLVYSAAPAPTSITIIDPYGRRTVVDADNKRPVYIVNQLGCHGRSGADWDGKHIRRFYRGGRYNIRSPKMRTRNIYETRPVKRLAASRVNRRSYQSGGGGHDDNSNQSTSDGVSSSCSYSSSSFNDSNSSSTNSSSDYSR